MNQVYLLLRNNEQSGPYSHDDLPALQLTEKDMVKVAGSNSGWFYPYELGLPFELSTRLHKNSPVVVEPKMESIKPTPSEYSSEDPAAEVDQTIEELSKKITSMRNNLRMVEEQIHADKSGQPQKKPIAKARRKKSLASGAVMIALLFLLLVLSFLVYRQYLQPSEKNASITRGSGSKIEYVEEPLTYSYTDTSEAAMLDGIDTTETLLASTASAALTPSKPKRTRTKSQPGPVQSMSGSADNVVLHPEEINDDSKVALSYVLSEEQRKTLLQKIADLFKKKEEPVNTSSNPLTEETVNDKLKISIRTTNYSWLKGVQGLTLTLHNQSSQTVKAANVNVVYYNKENAVIEKSTVRFSNVQPSKSQAVAAPDHTWADHAGYEIVSVAVVKN